MHRHRELAEALDEQRIVLGAFDIGLEPGPAAGADELGGVEAGAHAGAVGGDPAGGGAVGQA